MRDNSASAYVLHPLDLFFILIYKGSNKIRVRRDKKKGVQVTKHWKRSGLITNYQIDSKVGVDVNARSELILA